MAFSGLQSWVTTRHSKIGWSFDVRCVPPFDLRQRFRCVSPLYRSALKAVKGDAGSLFGCRHQVNDTLIVTKCQICSRGRDRSRGNIGGHVELKAIG